MKHLSKFLLALAGISLGANAQAQLACEGPPIVDEYFMVKDRYRITLYPPQEGEDWIIWRPIRENRGLYPVGQSSGQSLAELEDALDFEGRILAIWDFSNAMDVCMSAQTAERWKVDPRVRFFHQHIVMYSDDESLPGGPDAARFRNNPQLTLTDSYTLKLPSVDFNELPGQYQDVRIEYLPQTGTWRLAGFRHLSPFRVIESVGAIVTSEVPAQVFLEVRGKTYGGCNQPGSAGTKLSDRAFTVYLYSQYVHPDCIGTTDVRDVRKVVPLEVYGLLAGTYTWTLNGQFEGSFTLPVDNVLE